MNNSHKMYSEIELDTDVMMASNHRLVQVLFEKCLQQIEIAKFSILHNKFSNKHAAIAKAMEIINYLRASLNRDDKKTRDLASLLDSIYVFLSESLLNAKMSNDIESLTQAYQVLNNVKSGWDGMNI